MTRRASQLEIEKYYFENFSRRFVLPEGEIVHGDKPDIIINGEKRTGIEITNFYVDQSGEEPSQTSRRDNAVSCAQAIYRERTGRNVEYRFGFSDGLNIRNVRKMAGKLACLAGRFDDYPPGRVAIEEFSDIPEVFFLWRGDEYEGCTWQHQHVARIPVMNQDSLKKIIENKEKKAKRYEGCDQLWLLIVIDYMNFSQDQEINGVKPDEIETAVFDKVVIYKTCYEQIIEVPIRGR